MLDPRAPGSSPPPSPVRPPSATPQHPRPRLYQQLLGVLQAHPRVAPLWRATKTALKRPALLRAYRQQLGRQQHRDFDVQVRDSRGATPYNEAHTRALLGARAAARRPLRSADGRPDVVAFGFENWERHGFWASLAQTCNLRFVNIGDLSRDAGIHESSEAGRRTLADACLRTIDTLQTQAPVSAAFFYIDSESLSPALFEGLRARRIWSILLCLDDKHRLAPRWERGVWVGGATVVPYVDLYWTIWRTGAQVIQNMGGVVWHAAPAADPAFHHPVPAERDIDVLFLGQKYGERAALVQFLRDRGIRVHAAGPGWTQGFVTFEESLRLYGRAKVVLGHGATGCMSDVTALKGRDFEAPMCGAVYVTSYNPELADCYAIGHEILCYGTPRDCSELVQWILSDPERQARIRHAAKERALRDHTWERRFSSLFSLFPT